MQIVKPYAKIISIKNREEGIDLHQQQAVSMRNMR